MPEITDEQKTKLKQIWQKFQQFGGQMTKEIRTEMEKVFTGEQLQKFGFLREKFVEENGSFFAEFFLLTGQKIQVEKEVKLFEDLSDAENAMIFLFFNGNLQQLTNVQKSTLRSKWEQLKVSS